MPTNIDHLQAFSNLDGLWEVIGIGKARHSTQLTKEVEIEVFLAKPDPQTMRFSAGSEIRSRFVGCGHLGMILVGSRWRGGYYEGLRSGDVICEGPTWVMGPKTFGRTVEVDGSYFHPTAPFSDAPVFQIRLGEFKDKKFAIVPAMEVLRFTFGVTSGFLRQMFDGVRDEEIAPDRPIFDRERSKWKNDKFHLRASRPLRDEEAKLGAALLTDPRLLQAHDKVFANLSSNLEWQKGLSAYVETTFPYVGNTHWSFRGRWICIHDANAKDGVSWRMLVTEILEIDYQPRVREIVVETPKKKSNPIAKELARPLRKGSAATTTLVIERPPHKSATPTPAWGSRRGLLLWMDLDRKAAGDNHASASATPKIVERPERMTGSTSDRESRGDRNVRAVQVMTAPPDPEFDSQAKTYEAIVTAADRLSWTLTDSEGGCLPGSDTWLLPIQQSKRSRLLAVSVHTEAGSAIIMDAGSRPSRRRALAVIARHDFCPVSEDDVNVLALHALRTRGHLGGRATARPANFFFAAHDRPPEAWTSSEFYARLMSSWINSVFRSAPALL